MIFLAIFCCGFDMVDINSVLYMSNKILRIMKNNSEMAVR